MGHTHTTIGGTDTRLTLPWWTWPLAALAGLLIALGSLSYAPSGRLNVLWLWLLWAGLPLAGAVGALMAGVAGRDRPWVFRLHRWRLQWYPNRAQRWQMLYYLNLLWLLAGLGLLVGFWLLLLFTDLAFGWSSTLIDGTPSRLFQWLSAPWSALWPAASPDRALLEATRYVRIEPSAGDTARAGDWWPFLMASLLVYNLLPRAVLAGMSRLLWRYSKHPSRQPAVRAPASAEPVADGTQLKRDHFANWADDLWLNWELDEASGPVLGRDAGWRQDQLRLEAMLVDVPPRLLWRVPANRSPVAELGDLIRQAREAGVGEQGLQVIADERTRPERHLASWQHFAREQQLTWVA